MAVSEQQIDVIVREVLARLNGAAAAPESKPKVAAGPHDESAVLRVDQKVVSLAQLEGRLAAVRQLIVPSKAVITPAARDELKRRQIAITYRVRGEKNNPASALQLVVGLAETKYEPAELVRALSVEGLKIERTANTGIGTVVSELSEQVFKGGKLCLVLTEKPSAALCVANRSHGVRAARAETLADVEEAIRDVGANLLVVVPGGKSSFVLKQMVRRFCQGDRGCPESLKQLLG